MSDINDQAIEEYENLSNLYLEAELADISGAPAQEQKAYNRRLNNLYNTFMADRNRIFSLIVSDIDNDFTELRDSMGKLREGLNNLEDLKLAISAMASIIEIITGALTLSGRRNLWANEKGNIYHLTNVDDLRIFEENKFNELTASDDMNVEQLIEERNFLRKIVTNLSCRAQCREEKVCKEP